MLTEVFSYGKVYDLLDTVIRPFLKLRPTPTGIIQCLKCCGNAKGLKNSVPGIKFTGKFSPPLETAKFTRGKFVARRSGDKAPAALVNSKEHL
jgi:hypothetical protein